MWRQWTTSSLLMLTLMIALVHHGVLSFRPAHCSFQQKTIFTVSTAGPRPSLLLRPSSPTTTSLHSVTNGIDWNTLSTAVVETFDGSTIVDPVVVSNVFWTSLQSKLISFVLGQVLATIVFTLVIWLIGSQFSNIMAFLSDRIGTLWNQQQQQQQQSKLQIPTDLQDPLRRASTSIPPDFSKLLLCMAIDVIGTSSELIPFVGEITDVVYAPVAAWMLRSIFGSNNVLFLLEFAEEILPFTDILPLATICWVVDTYYRDSNLAKFLQLGNYAAADAANATTNIEPNLLSDDRNTKEMITRNDQSRQP